MCGIAGMLSANGVESIDFKLLARRLPLFVIPLAYFMYQGRRRAG